MFGSGNVIIIGTQCYILVYYRMFKFRNGQITEFRRE